MTSRLLLFRGLLPLFALVGTLHAVPTKFDIPAQPAPSALRLFIKQSGTEVLFIQEDLANTTTNAVTGEYEPESALNALLVDTGFAARKGRGGKFTVVSTKPLPGAIEGSIREEKSGRPVANARVQLAGTDQLATTDKRGRFVLEDVVAGSQILLVTADGMQNTRVTDVTVSAGHRLSLSPIGIPVAQSGTLQLDPYVVSAKKNDGVIELDPMDVEGRREKPFVAGNMDIPRTINDAQPYVIFDAKAIESSGADNLEGFLRNRLTMNAADTLNSQVAATAPTGNPRGTTSEINLRGLGADKTLVLINGRRVAGITIGPTDYQPDLNGIPLAAIERIEVLPSSASGIYGGSAIGGVINVILKSNYSGGEVRATYSNAWNTDAAKRNVTLSYGRSLEGGRTQLTFSASWSDANQVLLQDRRAIIDESITAINANSPTFLFNSSTPWYGSLPNIRIVGSGNLTLRDGRSLNSPITFVSAGTSPATPAGTLANSLLANAGKWNFELPPTTQNPTGLLRPIAATPQNESLHFGLRRQFLPSLEIFADFSYTRNNSTATINPFSVSFAVLATAPNNPFTNNLFISFPVTLDLPQRINSSARAATIGALLKLPGEWTAELDYTWSESRFTSLYYTADPAFTTAVRNGTLYPFVDTLAFPLSLDGYFVSTNQQSSNRLHDLALRAAGKLPLLPWGRLTLTTGGGRRINDTPERTSINDYTRTPLSSDRTTFYARESITDSLYAETFVPVVKQDLVPFVHQFDLQLAGRVERYTVDTGTPFETEKYNLSPVTISYGSPNLNNAPFKSRASYDSHNFTVGIRYQPTKNVTLRISQATAFLPPAPSQLIKNPVPDSGSTTIDDPVTGTRYAVQTIGGGNPNLKPQNSKSFNAGIIWEPRIKPFEVFRLNAEHYKIDQFDAIGTLAPALILANRDLFGDRILRDATTGLVTLIDASMINLYHRESEGWDFRIDVAIKTAAGRFSLNATETMIVGLRNQYSRTLPEYEAVDFPSEGGALKHKGNATLAWDWRHWSVSWTARYFGSYKMYGATGGPSSQQANGGTGPGTLQYITAQGGHTVAAQHYHDLYVGYRFGNESRGSTTKLSRVRDTALRGLSLHAGVGNIFGAVPPLDAARNNSTYYRSPYGSLELRTYWLSVRKQF